MPPLKLSSRAGRRLGLAVLLVLAGSDGLQDAVANGDTRTLSLYHLHTRDSITVTFKRNGQFDQAGLATLNHFLRDWRNDHQTKMDPRLFDIVWQVYQDAGATRPIEIISAYRSPATNSMLRRRSRGVAKASQHMLGKAMDFNIPGVPLERVRNAGLRLQRGGVGFYPSSGSPFVHLDVGSVRHWPRLSPDALARVFPDGRTVHIPSNGRPMPGYALALADIARRGASPSAVTVAAAANAGIPAEEEEQETSSSSSPRTWLARMFGRSQQQEVAGDRSPKTRERAREPVQVADAVPMPRRRPAGAPEAASVAVASAPASAGAPTTPAEIIAARGFWRGSELATIETPVTAGSASGRGPRLVWQVGPQAATPVSAVSAAAGPRLPTPRPRPATRVMASAAETTASVPWPVGTREDRIPSDLTLAYAANATAAALPETSVRAAPMGSLRAPAARSQASRETASPARATALPSPRASTRRLAGNPWLRSVMLAPSMHAVIGVTALGPRNFLTLTPLLHKPATAVSNAFAADPDFGLSTTAFSGRAVAFVPMIDFRRITVGLN